VVVGFSPDLHAVMTRFNADGTPDRDFGTVTLTAGTQTEQARAVVVQPDGRIVVAGSVIDAAGQDDVGVWRVLPSGKPDTTFGGGDGYLQFGDAGVVEVPYDVALDHRGRIVVAGVGQGAGFDVLALRVTASGLPDPTFNHGSTSFDVNHFGTDVGVAVAVQKDNQIVVAANYAGARGYAALRIAPGDATPSGFAGLDQTFGDGGVADVAGTLPANQNTDVAVTRDGHILLLDGLPSISTPGGADATVVQLDSSGNVDPTFGSATGARLPVPQGAASIVGEGIALLPHGDIAVAGDSGTGSNGFVAEVSRTGAPDTGMGPHGVKPLRALEGMVGAASLADGRKGKRPLSAPGRSRRPLLWPEAGHDRGHVGRRQAGRHQARGCDRRARGRRHRDRTREGRRHLRRLGEGPPQRRSGCGPSLRRPWPGRPPGWPRPRRDPAVAGSGRNQSVTSATGLPSSLVTSTEAMSDFQAAVAPLTCIDWPGRPFQVATRSVRPSLVCTTSA
jgi:uncharacterized delta-60 repeat protein